MNVAEQKNREFMRVFGARVFGARVFGACVFGARVFGARVFGARVFGACVFGACVFGARVFGVPENKTAPHQPHDSMRHAEQRRYITAVPL